MRAPTLTILRSLPMRRLQPAVSPLPEKTRFDRELTAELDALRSQGQIGLPQKLDAAITTHKKIASDFLRNIISDKNDVDRVAVDKYLEDNVEILDVCNYFVDKMGHINEYVDLLRVVLHLAERGGSGAATRALELLDSCQGFAKRCANMEKNRSSCLKKMLRQKLCHIEGDKLSEVMCGSKAMALMCCRFLELGLSFDTKHGLPLMKLSQPASSCSWMRLLEELAKEEDEKKKMKNQRRRCWSELQQTVTAARELRKQMKGKKEKETKYAVEGLKMSCKELEHGVEIVEERVKILYKSLIDVRMSLLGILSQPTTVFRSD
ncbi:hypothetical protein Fmac_024279 [Flemingia macrophylla]|uniref:Uncharacterized protein n=1 Tax=Flemingia macrophylla TaxID=520843 RepID=A0ABD1LP26_9FABA